MKTGFVFLTVLTGLFIIGINIYGADIAEWKGEDPNTAREVSYLTEEEKQIIAELNKARLNPRDFAEKNLTGQHSGSACYEKIRNMQPMPVLYPSKELSAAAKDHVNDIGKSGKQGSVGSDGSSWWQRIQRHGIWSGIAGESICYGHKNPSEVIVQLLLHSKICDEQVETLLNPKANFAGVAAGPHTVYQTMCVLTFATDIKEGGVRRK